MLRLYLIRHAESYGNIKGKIISTTDFELTEKGMAQSQRIGQKISAELKGKPISAYCSSLARAKQTLLEILRCMGQGNTEITETDLLKEMNLGLLEGMSWEDRRQKYPEVDLDKRLSLLMAPCGECYQDVKNRCQIFAEKYLAEKDNGQNIIIVSHGITLRVLTNFLTELIWEKRSQTYQVVRLNDYSHLKELKTIGYENWGLFAEGDYLSQI